MRTSIGLTTIALVLAACSGTSTTTLPSTTTTTAATTTLAPTTTATTSTTLPPTTTSTTAPTTTTASGPDLTDPETVAVLFIFLFETSRDAVIDALESSINVDSVDKYVAEAVVEGEATSAQVILDVTSRWRAEDNQHEGAWEITKLMAILWRAPEGPGADEPEGPFYSEYWVPDLEYTNSGRTYLCTGEFLVQLADTRKSMSDWEAECA